MGSAAPTVELGIENWGGQFLKENLGRQKKKMFTTLFFFFFLAVLGLICGTRDLCCGTQNLSLRCAGFSLAVVLGL